MKRIILITMIILFYPFVGLAHEGEAHLAVDPTALPGEPRYLGERIGEWFQVNLFTLSTKKKQEKKLELAEERAAEILALVEKREVTLHALAQGLRRYQYFIRNAEDMAEKIIVLDGAEIGIAEDLENRTRLHEQVFLQALQISETGARPLVLEALNEARIQNETIFKFMVKNYQASEPDILKHKRILDRHIWNLEGLSPEFGPDFDVGKFREYLKEAKEFRDAGLNTEAYDWVNKAKNALYSHLIQ